MKKLAILADSFLRNEIENKGWNDAIEVYWVESLDALIRTNADAYFDFSFEDSREHITAIKKLSAAVFISEICSTAESIDSKLIRVNCWPGMLSRKLVELAPGRNADIDAATKLFHLLGWEHKLVPDIPGFLSCRILAAIINEAYFTLQDGVSSRNEIDIAMKLGTNYPFGPFEWAERIGVPNLLKLLNKMSTENSKYLPAELLVAQ